MKLNFDDKKNVLIVQRFCLRRIRFWPGDDGIKNWQVLFAIASAFGLLTFAICQFWYSFVNIENFTEFLRAFSSPVSQTTDAFKLLVVVARRKDFKRIIDFILKAHSEGKLSRKAFQSKLFR